MMIVPLADSGWDWTSGSIGLWFEAAKGWLSSSTLIDQVGFYIMNAINFLWAQVMHYISFAGVFAIAIIQPIWEGFVQSVIDFITNAFQGIPGFNPLYEAAATPITAVLHVGAYYSSFVCPWEIEFPLTCFVCANWMLALNLRFGIWVFHQVWGSD